MITCKCGCGEEVIQRYRQGKEQLYVDARHRGRHTQRVRRERLRSAGLPAEPRAEGKQAEYNQASRMRRRGLDPVAYRAMFEAQHGLCAICSRPPKGKAFAIDHDHSCCPPRGGCFKCIRGLLCSACNTGLGFFGDNAELLAVAAQYLSGARPNAHGRCKRGHPYDIEWVEGERTVRRCSTCRRMLQRARRGRKEVAPCGGLTTRRARSSRRSCG